MALSSVGMFGDGITHGAPISSAKASRRQPSIVTTSTSAPSWNCSLKSRASSPMVMPWRIGIGNWPTNDSKPGTSVSPSTATPPIGLGRSQTMTGTPWRAQARRQLASV